MIQIEALQKIGISKNEAIVLSKIIHTPEITVTELIESTRMNRKVVYDAIRRLSSNSLITSKKVEQERKYVFSGEASLHAIIEEEKQKLNEKESQLKEVITEIKKTSPSSKTDVATYSGTIGVRTAYNKLLSLKSDYVAYGGSSGSERFLREEFWLNLHQKQKELKIKIKLLLNESLKVWLIKWLKQINNPNIQVRYIKETSAYSQTIICKDHVIVTIWSGEPQSIIIVDNNYAKFQKEIFNILWKTAKK
ncbi:MAG: helix-turn-helix domain-containing protein [Candidatus Woesearchaeota archaeon]